MTTSATSTDSSLSPPPLMSEVLPLIPRLPRGKPNQLVQLLEMFSDKPWNYHDLSRNPNITMEWIMAHQDCAWDWVLMCQNPNLTMNFLLNTLLPKLAEEEKEQRGKPRNWQSEWIKEVKQWDQVEEFFWRLLSVNPGLKYSEIRAHYISCPVEERERYKWQWNEMACRSDVTVEMLLTMASTATNLMHLSRLGHPNDELKKWEEPIDPTTFDEWSGRAASQNPNLTADIVLKYPGLWNREEIGSNPAIVPTKELIANGYYTSKLSTHPRLPFQLVLDHYNTGTSTSTSAGTGTIIINYNDGKFNWPLLSSNPAITLEMILAHPEFPWDWCYISSNPNLTVQYLQSSSLSSSPGGGRRVWDSEYLSCNPNLPADFIFNSRNDADETKRFLAFDYFCDNPNLTVQLIAENLDQPWEWNTFSQNDFAFDKDSLAHKEVKYHEAADLIVWNALLFVDSNHLPACDTASTVSVVRRLPTALAKLPLQYFSPFY